jgi:hypothetical protein
MSNTLDLLETEEETMTTNIAKQILEAISNIRWGSVEIFIQNSKIVQITERNIRKPHLEEKENGSEERANAKIPS